YRRWWRDGPGPSRASAPVCTPPPGAPASRWAAGSLNQTLALDKADDRVEALPGLDVGEYERALAAHFPRVALHHLERSADHRREVDLVDDQEVRLHDPGPAFPRDLVAGGDVDHVQRQIREFGAE